MTVRNKGPTEKSTLLSLLLIFIVVVLLFGWGWGWLRRPPNSDHADEPSAHPTGSSTSGAAGKSAEATLRILSIGIAGENPTVEECVDGLCLMIGRTGIPQPSSGPNASSIIGDAIKKAGVVPSRKQFAELCRELNAVAETWKRYHRSGVNAEHFWATVQLLVYWYLAPADLTDEEQELRAQQHDQIRSILSSLPRRLFRDYGVPVELRDKIIALTAEYTDEIDRVLDSRFLRFMQAPVPPDVFEKQREEIEKDIDEWGHKLKKELARQRRTASPKGNYFSCRALMAYMYGEPIKVMCLGNIRYARKTGAMKQLFPFGIPDTYGVKLVLYKRTCFHVTPRSDRH